MGTKSKNKAVVLCTGGDGCTVCGFGCLGDGKCAEVCRFDAISINTFNVAEVDREKCRGCGLCVKACPQNIIDLVPAEDSYSPRCSNHDKGAEAKKICSSSCIACRICEKACPSGAIAVTDNCAVINHVGGFFISKFVFCYPGSVNFIYCDIISFRFFRNN